MVQRYFGHSLLERIQGELIDAGTGARLGGQELRASVERCAIFLSNCAEKKTGPILLALDLSLESAVVYLGALLSGRTVVPMDAKEWQQKGNELIEFMEPALCWLPSRLKTAAANRLDHVMIIQGMPAIQSEKCDFSSDSLFKHSALISGSRLMAPTSGSTGSPSFVLITDTNLIANTQAIIESQGLSGKDKALLCLPLHYCFGASVLHSHLWAGGSVVLDNRMMFPEKILDAMETQNCTVFAGVPTSFFFLSSHSSVLKRQFSKLRLWLQAGGYLSASVVHAFRHAHPATAFAIMYGQTEATARITTFIVDGNYPKGCVGFPLPGIELQIRTEELQAGLCQEGEVWIKGSSVCAGYFLDPERNAEKFAGDWMKTGDVGYLLDDGRLCITGRSDGFIKVRGRRINAHEIEDLIWQAAHVRCCACAVPHQVSGEVVGLYVEYFQSNGETESPATTSIKLTEQIRRVLPQYCDLGPILFGELPLTSNGKINRKACSKLLMEKTDK